jgi:hypothetical protein
MAATTGATLEQLIGLPALMGLMQETTTGLPDPTAGVGLDKVTDKILGNSARMFVGFGQRKTARLVKYGSPAVTAGLEDLAAQDYVLISSTEVQPVDPLTFQRLHDFNNYDLQKMGAGEMARQIGLYKAKFDNSRLVAKWSAMRYGAIYADASGNLLPTSSGAASDWTIDFGIAAGHKTQLNFDGNGNLIANLWSDATNANIPTQIENLQAAALKETGLPLKYAFYGSNVPGYVRKNTYMQAYVQYDTRVSHTLNVSTQLPDGLLGLTWVPVQGAFFQDSGGTNRSMFGVNDVIFTPDPAKGKWWGMAEGSTIVPNSIDLSQRTASDIMANAQTVYGQWACARYQFDGSVSLLNYLGDNFMPILKNPKAVFVATVA